MTLILSRIHGKNDIPFADEDGISGVVFGGDGFDQHGSVIPLEIDFPGEIELRGEQFLAILLDFDMDVAGARLIKTREDGTETVDAIGAGQGFAIKLKVAIAGTG